MRLVVIVLFHIRIPHIHIHIFWLFCFVTIHFCLISSLFIVLLFIQNQLLSQPDFVTLTFFRFFVSSNDEEAAKNGFEFEWNRTRLWKISPDIKFDNLNNLKRVWLDQMGSHTHTLANRLSAHWIHDAFHRLNWKKKNEAKKQKTTTTPSTSTSRSSGHSYGNNREMLPLISITFNLVDFRHRLSIVRQKGKTCSSNCNSSISSHFEGFFIFIAMNFILHTRNQSHCKDKITLLSLSSHLTRSHSSQIKFSCTYTRFFCF